MYFRAWEYALNESVGGFYAPFKPFTKYEGKMSGDLIDMFNFARIPKSISEQKFQIDEYGFRNRIGLFDHPIKAVTIGTSWVGGAHETQKNLVSELLTDKYEIPTYNYATQPLQHFWEDTRFIKNPPKYLLIVGSEIEFLQNHYIETLIDTKDTHDVPKWKNYEEWSDANEHFPRDYQSLAPILKRYSITKYYLRESYLSLTNTFFTRKDLATYYGNDSLYDSINDVLFFNLGSFDPSVKSAMFKNITPTIKTLKETQRILATRGIIMITAVVPSKESMHAALYRDLPLKNKILYHLEGDLDKNGIYNIPLLKDFSEYVKNTSQLVYYSDDSHWNAYVNKIIAKKAAEKIKSIENEPISDK